MRLQKCIHILSIKPLHMVNSQCYISFMYVLKREVSYAGMVHYRANVTQEPESQDL